MKADFEKYVKNRGIAESMKSMPLINPIVNQFAEEYAKQEKESYLQKFRKYWNRFNARAFYITDEHIQKFKDDET
jgi:hypothetical protein